MSDPTPIVVKLPAFSISAPPPWNRITWAEILAILVARLTAQGFIVTIEDHDNAE
jgi:hypothetical protein